MSAAAHADAAQSASAAAHPPIAADRRSNSTSRRSTGSAAAAVAIASGRRSADPEGEWTAESMAYLKACAAYSIRPNGEVTRVLCAPSARNIVIMQLQSNYLGDGGVRCLASILNDVLPSLRGLGLAGNGIANDGVDALCKAIAPPHESRLAVVDLQENTKITRAGGQTLLNAAGKCRQLVYLYLENTRVTEYFAKRIATHTQLNFTRCCEAERLEIEEVIDALNGVDDEEDSQDVGGGRNMQVAEDELATPIDGNLSSGGAVAAASTQADISSDDGDRDITSAGGVDDDDDDEDVQFTHGVLASNEPFDEAFYVADDGEEMVLDLQADNDSYRAVSRPNAPSGLETVLFSTTPDFIAVFQQAETVPADGTVTAGKFTITNMPVRGHTVYGFSTPTPYEYDIFAFVDQYKPVEIELPTKFIFPGRIDYTAAVHAPDAFIGPPMPSLLPTLEVSKRRAEEAAKAQQAQVGDDELDEDDKPAEAEAAEASAPPATVSSKAQHDSDDEASVAVEDDDDVSAVGTVTPPAPPPPPPANSAVVPTLALPSVGPSTGGAAAPSTTAATTVASGGTEPSRNSMYWNFFHTAAKTPDASQCTTPRETQLHQQTLFRSSTNVTLGSHSGTPVETSISAPQQQQHNSSGDSDSVNAHLKLNSPNGPAPPSEMPPSAAPPAQYNSEDYVDGTVEALLKVPRYISAAPSHVAGRLLKYSCGEPESAKKSLCELMLDPRWTPSQPTRGAQVSEYCKTKRLKYNYVMMERMKISENAPREFYLQRIIRPSLTDKLTAGTMDVTGRLLATSSYDMTCKIWDLETGKKLHTLRGHQGHLSDCIWNTPRSDKIITASFDKTVRVWDVATGSLIHTMRGHELEVVCMCVSPDGLECVSGGMDDLAVIWDVEKGTEKFSLTGHNAEVVTVDYSPVGNLVVTGSMDEQLRVWNSTSGACIHVLEGHTQEVAQAKFNKFGNMILSGSSDGTCRLWDVATGNSKVLRGHTHEVVDVDFSPDGWTCASASDDGTARIWDVLTGGCLSMLVGHQKGVCRVAFTKEGKELLTGSLDSTAKVWNIDTAECKQTLRGHRNVVLVFYNALSDRILTLSKDNTCRVWRLEPKTDTLFHKMALALCQHPTMYTDVAAANHLPPAMDAMVQRIYKKLHRTDREALTAPTPLPQMRSPDPDEVDSSINTPANTTPVAMMM